MERLVTDALEFTQPGSGKSDNEVSSRIRSLDEALREFDADSYSFERYLRVKSRLASEKKNIDAEYKSRRNLKSIFLIAQPSSASVHITNELSRHLGYPKRRPSSSKRSHMVVDEEIIEELVEAGGISRIHLDPHLINIQILDASQLDRVIVTIRDPRASILSLAHWPHGPAGPYMNLPLSSRIDILIGHELPRLIFFLDGWLKARLSENLKFDIFFARFEDLKSDYHAFFDSILEFYEIPREEFQGEPTQCKPGEDLLRKGSVDEWRSVFTPEQIDRANSKCPERIFEIFEWQL